MCNEARENRGSNCSNLLHVIVTAAATKSIPGYQLFVPWQPVFAHVFVVALYVPFAILTSCTPLTWSIGAMIVIAAFTTVAWQPLHFMPSLLMWRECWPDMPLPFVA